MTSTARHTELRYSPQEIDRKWQERWERDGLYRVEDNDPRPKWYELTMYPYPSGDLHIGHWYAMAPSDAHARFRRMQGYNVLHPMGFDSFGLPAENAAIRQQIHPYDWTVGNIENMTSQLRSMGAIYDWTRQISTMEPEYYRWNQWIFLQLHKAGLSYRANAPVNWCPADQTVLANEQVIDGKCERCDTPVARRDLEQWFFRITKYADELLDFSGVIDWPERIKTLQENWIGRSEGVDISFDISHLGIDEKEIRTFTTRIDTIYGVTFMVLAPEHPLVRKITTVEQQDAVNRYIDQARRQSEIERLSTEREKTGVFTGAYAVNRLNGEQVPIFVGDYVLLSYGTGAVMGVPAHDQRDFDFAKKHDLPINVVIAPPNWDGSDLDSAYLEAGAQVNSGPFDGMPSSQGIKAIAEHVEEHGWGSRTVSYRVRDWLISRQRYWGTPIPVVYCERCGTVPVPEEDLPVLLPRDAEFRPTGESPLASNEEFVNTSCPDCDEPARRETDTMDTFVDSSWYQLRFTSPDYDEAPFNPEAMKTWNPVNQYTGGAEHAVMHLLYTRFFTKALRDVGLLDFNEPFLRLFNQGTIIAEHHKMSKSRGNVIAPDPYVQSLGADVVRIYLMFLGPWDQGGDWTDSGINGMTRWANRVWDIAQRDSSQLGSGDPKAVRDLTRATHKTIRKVVTDIERFHFNTALAAMMEFSNALGSFWDAKSVDAAAWDSAVDTLLLLLAPIAPHITEELWERRGKPYSIHNQPLPAWDEDLAADEMITLVVQVNGKVRDKLTVAADISEADAKRSALDSPRVQAHVYGKQVQRLVYVPGRLVNVVVGWGYSESYVRLVPSKGQNMKYRLIDRITAWDDGVPIELKLQQRLEVPPEPFYCLTWRTVYPGSRSKNRRFYRLNRTGFWTIPFQLALDVMKRAEGRGWLDSSYDDLQVRHRGTDNTVIDSRKLSADKRRAMFASITSVQGEPDWGDDPVFIIIQVPNETWRKIMIVDTARAFCTFRSATTDLDYTPVIADPHLNPWRMDNAMQDASAEMIRTFLKVLDSEA